MVEHVGGVSIVLLSVPRKVAYDGVIVGTGSPYAPAAGLDAVTVTVRKLIVSAWVAWVRGAEVAVMVCDPSPRAVAL